MKKLTRKCGHRHEPAMLVEHNQGRAFAKAMEEAATRVLNGEAGQEEVIVVNAPWNCCASTARRG